MICETRILIIGVKCGASVVGNNSRVNYVNNSGKEDNCNGKLLRPRQ